MLNVIELENRWKTYKIKSFIPHAIIAASVLLISVVGYSFLQSKESNQVSSQKNVVSETIDANTHTQNETKTETAVVQKTKTKPTIVENQEPLAQKIPLEMPKDASADAKMKLAPSLSFINEMNSNIPYYQNTEASQATSDAQNLYQSQEQTQEEVIEEKNEEKIVQAEEVKSVKIERKNTHDDILQVIERFKKSNDPALSLFVAKKYYELEDYHKSYNYALITNELNNNIEASWIIFAKSLVKLNEKEMALKTLRQYIEHSGSNQAKLLLEEIRNGKFK
ncbi:MAG: hypothetical protein PHI89_00225 [Thiovulaceae bacterium]|nr:hypothetical protein [Sulfurimonadaceae bacterium]